MKVALIGTAPGSRAVAPFEDPSWKIWACSQGNQGVLPRVDAWFELHTIGSLTGPENKSWGLPYLGWLRSQTFPVYMQEKNDLVPQAIVFPIRRIVDTFTRNWLTSSIAMMGYYALLQMREGDELGLFGVDMAAAQEHYTAQKAGLWRLFEIAKDRGVKIFVPDESCLGQEPPIYAYCEATIMGRRLYFRRQEFSQMLAALEGQRAKLDQEIAYTKGAIEQNDYMIRTFLDGTDAQIDAMMPVIVKPELPAPVTARDFTEVRGSGLIVPPTKGNGAGAQTQE